MAISVNSNRSALNALQTLARSADPSQQTRTGPAARAGQERSPAQTGGAPRADVVSLAQMQRSLDRAASISDVALSAGQTVSDILQQLREEQADADAPRADQARLQAALRQIDQTVRRAAFEGVNLLDGSLGEDLRIGIDANTQIALPARDLRPGGAYVTLDEAFEGDAAAARGELERSSVNVSSALADLRIQSRQLAAHNRFVSRFGETLVSEHADGELSKEGARLHALRIQQQLAAQQLPIANQAPQLVLQLFRS